MTTGPGDDPLTWERVDDLDEAQREAEGAALRSLMLAIRDERDEEAKRAMVAGCYAAAAMLMARTEREFNAVRQRLGAEHAHEVRH